MVEGYNTCIHQNKIYMEVASIQLPAKYPQNLVPLSGHMIIYTPYEGLRLANRGEEGGGGAVWPEA